ncbi:MAG: hypothetical protein AB2556_26375 [Candidatus Thiodiazotropha sp.]
MGDPAPGQFTDLDDQVAHPVMLPADQWVEILNDFKQEFEVDSTTAVFSSWRVGEEDPLDIGNIEFSDGIHARAGQLALDAGMTDERAARLLDSLPKGGFVLKLKFLCEQQEGEWAVKDKFDPVREQRKKGQAIIEISRDTKHGVLTGINRVFYQNAYHLRSCLPPLHNQRPRPSQPRPTKRRRPQLCGPESCEVL